MVRMGEAYRLGTGPERCTPALRDAMSKCRETARAQPRTRAFSFWTLE